MAIEQIPNLPARFKKIEVHTLSNDFDAATRIVIRSLSELINSLKEHEVVVKYLHLGINGMCSLAYA